MYLSLPVVGLSSYDSKTSTHIFLCSTCVVSILAQSHVLSLPHVSNCFLKIISLRILSDSLLLTPLMPYLLPYPPHLCLFLISYLQSPVCAAHIFMGVQPSTGAWLTYQGQLWTANNSPAVSEWDFMSNLPLHRTSRHSTLPEGAEDRWLGG